MPVLTAERLRGIGRAMFTAAGCTAEEAQVVSDHLVQSNLFGHDSHGALRFYEYCEGIRQGRYRVGGEEPDIVRESPSTAVIDGGRCIGAVGATFAMNRAVEKARANGVAMVTLRNTTHIGRVGAYPLQAAEQGMMAQVVANAGHLGFEIAPFGGIDGKLTSDPIAFAAPRRDGPPIMLDMTTSMAAVGKIWVAENRGESLPDGWIVDSEGRPSTNPRDFTQVPRGAMLPLGGASGHKGYGLALMVELMGGALSGQGCAAGETVVKSNGVAMVCVNIDHFVDRDAYFDEVETMIRHVKSSRTAPGHEVIYLPGEIEFQTAARKEKEGIGLDEGTWEKIRAEAAILGVDVGG